MKRERILIRPSPGQPQGVAPTTFFKADQKRSDARRPKKTEGRSCGKVFIRRRTKRFLYLCNDEGRGESAAADKWAFFSSR